MSLSLNKIKGITATAQKIKRRGRGNASGHGTYSCRGQKGQRARSGGSGGLKYKGMKSMLMSLPKYRGFKPVAEPLSVINIGDLEQRFSANDKVNRKILFKKNLINDLSRGLKILGGGKLTKKLTIEATAVSASAREAIEAAGGRIIIK